METPTANKIVEIELSKLKNEHQFIFNDNLTPFSLKVRNQVNKEQGIIESPIPSTIKKSNTLDALNLELIEFPRFEEFESIAQKIGKEDIEEADEDSTEEEEEEQAHNISNDSTDMKLDTLGIQDSPLMKFPIFQDVTMNIPTVPKDKNAEFSLEEFPIYDFKHQTADIIDHEEVLQTPEIIRSSKVNDKIESNSTPTKKSSTNSIKRSKSKIPLPASLVNEVRRSKRLENQIPVHINDRNVCTPKSLNSKSNPIPILRIKSENSLNFIVDASTGKLHDATQYATEINASNGEGVPIPQTINEQVTVPVNGPKRTKTPKTAIVRGYLLKLSSNGIKGNTSSNRRLGFYSEADYKKYFNPKHSPVKIMKPQSNSTSPTKKTKAKELNTKRSVRWAEQLEW
ncbi:hypothetical protein BN7_2949 [Wickerhamomyces ciferrii]|uniref:Uncharacterized protein n=1 Tax=Wickerhamomyces ciferrii (strain ATCC 14091 / BCRC 22168 / CBS 111 / JCM 3599 / NBRC 0793 / NRRL Y-1031 F-60-10) TaxID=1206466 RepID=K0KKC3_WICCF|nr:uncharacterized protein BN7_2949 [Wickerhamomyces ciferrii]CCH43401.1 hypothetical protein BN7_2949 [Wickerhamomyces ciferrii]